MFPQISKYSSQRNQVETRAFLIMLHHLNVPYWKVDIFTKS